MTIKANFKEAITGEGRRMHRGTFNGAYNGRDWEAVVLVATLGESESQRRDYECREAEDCKPVRVFDEGGYVVERWDDAAVAQRPVVAAPHAGAGDPNHEAEYDDRIGEGGGGECQPAEGFHRGRGWGLGYSMNPNTRNNTIAAPAATSA